jgi:hypothetical protein
MKKLILLAGAAALIGAGPAIAGPGHGKGHGPKAKVVKVTPVRTVKVKTFKNKRVWVNACPRGLVWRGATCVPPGHAKRILVVGARVPNGWAYTPWGAVPLNVRNAYDLDPHYRYIYRDGVIYAVNPRTHLITSIINAVL